MFSYKPEISVENVLENEVAKIRKMSEKLARYEEYELLESVDFHGSTPIGAIDDSNQSIQTSRDNHGTNPRPFKPTSSIFGQRRQFLDNTNEILEKYPEYDENNYRIFYVKSKHY